MAIDDFLEQERAAGRQVTGNSTFTLDPKEVRKRVGTFCREFRLYPLLRCLQAIIRITESDVFIRHEQGRWVVTFLWREVPEKEAFLGLVEEGTTRAFDGIPGSATQHFFFGLMAALGQEQYEIIWRSPKGGFTINERELAHEGTITDLYCELHFAVDPDRWAKLTGRDQYSEIRQELSQRLCYAPVPIHIEREMLHASPPKAPERPWGSQLKQGSQLAWRFLYSNDVGRVRAPKLPLDRYRVGQKGKIWHLLRDQPDVQLPLSVQLGDLSPSGPVTMELPSEARCRFERTLTGLGDDLPPSESALYLSLEAGRKDWFYPVRDGVLCEPTPVKLLKGSLVAVCGSARLRYDLSGLRVIEDDRFQAKLEELRAQAKALNRGLLVSGSVIATRAENIPTRMDQATGYAMGGPYFGLLAGKLGPRFRGFFGKPQIPDE